MTSRENDLLHEFVSLPKLESSRDVTSKVMSNRLKKGNQNPQRNNMIASFSFASKAHVTQWSNYLTQRAKILTRQPNLTPQRAKNTVNDLFVVSAIPKSLLTLTKLASQFHSFLPFFSRDQQAFFFFFRMEVILADTSLLLPEYTEKKI